jgi:hypothetical protein
MEFLISSLLYKQDFSRVVYSKDDICFRRRVETLGKGDLAGGEYNHVSLDLPFTSYSQTGNYEPDDRASSMNAAAAIVGHMQPDSGVIVKNMPVKIKYSMTSFFARRDDVNIASQLLYWESNPKFPLYYIVHHTIAGYPIDIPVFMTIEQTEMNTDYQEKNWLQQSKIFPLKTDVTIRTYQTLIESIDPNVMLPLRFQGLYGYNDSEIYFTQNAVLLWADTKWSPDELKHAESVDESYAEYEGPNIPPELANTAHGVVTIDALNDVNDGIANYGKMYPASTEDEYSDLLKNKSLADEKLIELADQLQHEVDQESIDRLAAEIEALKTQIQFLQDAIVLAAADTVEEAVKGYFVEDPDVVLDIFHVDQARTTETELCVEWRIRESDVENFEYLSVYVPGIENKKITEPEVTSFVIHDLHPGSTYAITIVTHSKHAGSNTYRLEGTTKGEVLYKKGAPKKLSDNLVGKTFTSR